MIRRDKEAVRAAFSAASTTYDASSPMQREVGQALVEFLRKLRPEAAAKGPGLPESILDAGCGTGRLSCALKREYPDAAVVGCDFALPMLIEARKANTLRRLVVADVDDLPFPANLFDLIASNLAYQWPPDTLASFREAGRVLKTGGWFVFSTLGPRTLFEMREACDRAAMPTAQMSFLRPDEISGILGRARLDVIAVERRSFTREYADMRALLRALRDIGAMPHPAASASTLITGVLLKKAGRVYREKFPGLCGGITATYDVVFAAARKD